MPAKKMVLVRAGHAHDNQFLVGAGHARDIAGTANSNTQTLKPPFSLSMPCPNQT